MTSPRLRVTSSTGMNEQRGTTGAASGGYLATATAPVHNQRDNTQKYTAPPAVTVRGRAPYTPRVVAQAVDTSTTQVTVARIAITRQRAVSDGGIVGTHFQLVQMPRQP